MIDFGSFNNLGIYFFVLCFSDVFGNGDIIISGSVNGNISFNGDNVVFVS